MTVKKKLTYLSYIIHVGKSEACFLQYIEGTLFTSTVLSTSILTLSMLVNIGRIPKFFFPIYTEKKY